MSGRLGRVGAQLGASAVCRPCAPLPMPSSDEIAKQMARCIEVSKVQHEYVCTFFTYVSYRSKLHFASHHIVALLLESVQTQYF